LPTSFSVVLLSFSFLAEKQKLLQKFPQPASKAFMGKKLSELQNTLIFKASMPSQWVALLANVLAQTKIKFN